MKRFVASLLVVLVSGTLMLIAVEYGLRIIVGLGDPILYDNNPIYGYRPLPNQQKSRIGGAKVKINNMGLRCNDDWNAVPAGKILFLGDSVTYGGSRVSNVQLFSSLIGAKVGRQSCSAGVNGWGVENIHALVVESGFMPAETYVTMLIEGDFYRGVTRLQGLPFFNRKPVGAIDEVLQFFSYMYMKRRYIYWEQQATTELKDRVVQRAVKRLSELDEALRRKGYRHQIFISPTRAQAVNNAPLDTRISKRLAVSNLPVIYINELLRVPGMEVSGAYLDRVHLSIAGHQLWADIIEKQLKH